MCQLNLLVSTNTVCPVCVSLSLGLHFHLLVQLGLYVFLLVLLPRTLELHKLIRLLWSEVSLVELASHFMLFVPSDAVFILLLLEENGVVLVVLTLEALFALLIAFKIVLVFVEVISLLVPNPLDSEDLVIESLHRNGACHCWWLLNLLQTPCHLGVLDHLWLLSSQEVRVVLVRVSFTDLVAIKTTFGHVVLQIFGAVEVMLVYLRKLVEW